MDAADDLQKMAEASTRSPPSSRKLSGSPGSEPPQDVETSERRGSQETATEAEALALALRRLAAGELDAEAPELARGSGLAGLAAAFEDVKHSLRDRARLEAELTLANRSLAENQSWLRVALELGQMGVWRRRIRGQALEVSAEQAGIFGFPPGVAPQEPDFQALYDPADWAELISRRDQFDQTGEPKETVVSFRRWDNGERRWVLIRREALAWADGRPVEEIGVVFDITERLARESRLQLMMDELNHRVKNNLATITSLAMQTARTSQGLPDFLDKFSGRVRALSQSNELLTRTEWGEVELREVAAAALRPFAAEEAVALGGEPQTLTVAPRAAVSLSLILHELCTNAAKYGALSCEGGRLEIAWRRLDAGQGEILWTERTPRPPPPPGAAGFGTRLIKRLSAGDLGGGSEIDFRPDGLVVAIRFKL